MFPLFFLFGFKSMEELMTNLGLTQNTLLQPMKYTQFKVNDNVLATLGTTEGIINVARNIGDGKITIGFGTTVLYNADGSLYNRGKVPNGISLSQLKVLMNYSNLSDLDFAKQLKTNHLNFDPTMINVRKMFSSLDALNVVYNENVAISLIDFAYNGGFGGLSYNNILKGFQLAKNDISKMASYYAQSRYAYLSRLSTYAKYSFGWLKRVFWISIRYTNPLYKYSEVDKMSRSVLKSEFFKKLGVLVSF